MSLFSRVMFFPSLAYNMAMERLTSRNWYDRIDDHLILGALPFRSVLEEIANTENVKGVLAFNEDFELHPNWYPTSDEFSRRNIKLFRLPTPDFVSTPSAAQVEEGLKFVDEIIAKNGTVYAHCKAGRFRSVYFVVAYVIKTKNMTVREAVDFVRSKRQQSWLGSKQIAQLQEFYETLHGEKE